MKVLLYLLIIFLLAVAVLFFLKNKSITSTKASPKNEEVNQKTITDKISFQEIKNGFYKVSESDVVDKYLVIGTIKDFIQKDNNLVLNLSNIKNSDSVATVNFYTGEDNTHPQIIESYFVDESTLRIEKKLYEEVKQKLNKNVKVGVFVDKYKDVSKLNCNNECLQKLNFNTNQLQNFIKDYVSDRNIANPNNYLVGSSIYIFNE